MKIPSVPCTILEAMARQEGFYIEDTLAQRHNNPGNMEFGAFALNHGALSTRGGRFAVFPTIDAGFGAMRELMRHSYLGLTLEQAIHKWAPSSENDTETYIKNVSLFTGLSRDTILTAENIG